MIDLPSDIDPDNIPEHIAIIMDGNGRWAKQRNKKRSYGHRNGAERIRSIVETCKDIGVRYLTLYAFSTENWKRSTLEVNFLWRLLVYFLNREMPRLKKEGVQFRIIGDTTGIPAFAQRAFFNGIEELKNNDVITLTLALNYGGRDEIIRAVRKWHEDVVTGKTTADELSETMLAGYMDTAGMPDPELLIRTAGELRVSNFLLYQLSYSEFYSTEAYWPDFDDTELFAAIKNYQRRIRRHGGIPDSEATP